MRFQESSRSVYTALQRWTHHNFRRRRNYAVTTLLCMAISTIFYNIDFISSLPACQRWIDVSNHTQVRDTQVFSHPASASKDAVFYHLHHLLTTKDPEARSECLRFYEAGGRCFTCTMAGEHVLGLMDGSKPVCLDLLRPNCSVLSFGVNHDFSFEEAMEDLGCMVHAFDPTMGVHSYRRSKGLHFHSLGIGSFDGAWGGFPVASLGSIVRKTRLQTGVIDYLKLDVETSEWEALNQQLTTSGDLLRVRQLNVEFHLFQWSPQIAEGEGMKTPDGGYKISYENAVRFSAVVKALNKAGFALLDGQGMLACQPFTRPRKGCLSYIYDTNWLNMGISGTSVV